MFDEFGINAGYVEELHTRWLQSPQSVEEGWRRFFEGTDVAPTSSAAARVPVAAATKNGRAHTNGNGSGAIASNGNGNGAAAAAAVAAVVREPSSAVAYREAVRETVIAAT